MSQGLQRTPKAPKDRGPLHTAAQATAYQDPLNRNRGTPRGRTHFTSLPSTNVRTPHSASAVWGKTSQAVPSPGDLGVQESRRLQQSPQPLLTATAPLLLHCYCLPLILSHPRVQPCQCDYTLQQNMANLRYLLWTATLLRCYALRLSMRPMCQHQEVL